MTENNNYVLYPYQEPFTLWTLHTFATYQGDPDYYSSEGYRVKIADDGKFMRITAASFDGHGIYTIHLTLEDAYNRCIQGLPAFRTYKQADFRKN